MERQARDDMVRLLVLEAGRFLEDLSPDLAQILPADEDVRRVRLGAMAEASAAATALLQAAIAICGLHEG
ncbi:hypothetical protein [Alteraurantiacibacter buctensis]|uniref:Uncharacterized protein n=1 Tax=Alteraurantiacibacter buctensis TaxID=1503981 RepID=A0A844Z2Y8_9SPHN|nr:hypothetical protein [Alteraurantiacibacter buctensis]MXO73054.1 hypothetical protein [Alteraurantiacibacter buctensis]